MTSQKQLGLFEMMIASSHWGLLLKTQVQGTVADGFTWYVFGWRYHNYLPSPHTTLPVYAKSYLHPVPPLYMHPRVGVLRCGCAVSS